MMFFLSVEEVLLFSLVCRTYGLSICQDIFRFMCQLPGTAELLLGTLFSGTVLDRSHPHFRDENTETQKSHVSTWS